MGNWNSTPRRIALETDIQGNTITISEAAIKRLAGITQPKVAVEPEIREVIREVEVEVIREVPVPYEVEVIKEVEVIREVNVEVPFPVEVEVIREVPVEVIREVFVEKEVPVEVIREVEVPVTEYITVEKLVYSEPTAPVEIEVVREVIVEKEVIKNVPYEVIKEVPVEVIVEVVKEVRVEVPYEVLVEVEKEVIREVEVPVTMLVEVTKEVPVEVIREVQVEVIKEVQVPVEVIVETENTEKVDQLEAMISVKDSEMLVKAEEVVRGHQLLEAKEHELSTLVERLSSKDAELASLGVEAEAKLGELRRQNEQLFDATSEAFNKGVAETAARFPSLELRPKIEAAGLTARLVDCYANNKGLTLNCSKVVAEFKQSLDDVRMDYLQTQMPAFGT